MTSRSPTISVCIPTFNRARYLPAALESVLRQTLQDFEIVVYDDASADESMDVLAAIRDHRLRVFRQAENVGIAANRNSCLAVARGKYIAWLDSDDLYLPHMLATQAQVLDQHRNVAFVHAAHDVIDADGQRLPAWPQPFAEDTVEPAGAAFRELAASNYVATPTVLVRRTAYDQAGTYSPALSNFCEDWEMWLRLALCGDVAYTASPVAQCRWHPQSASAAAARAGQRTLAEFRTIRRVLMGQRTQIVDWQRCQKQARAALAAKALARSSEARLRGDRSAALQEARRALRVASWLTRSPHSRQLLAAIRRGSEFAEHKHSQALLTRLCATLAGTRFGERLLLQVLKKPEWTQELRSIARTVQRCVPRDARVAAVDKWDPTLLKLCRRQGWHFPDLASCTDGYPADSQAAIAHLSQLIERGANYLVFTSASLWWLDHYAAFRQYLDREHRRAWADSKCVVYELLESAVPTSCGELHG